MLKKLGKNNELIIIILSTLYLLYRILYKPSVEFVGAFLLISAIHYFITNKIIGSLLMAIGFCLIWEIIYRNKKGFIENFAEKKKKGDDDDDDDDDDKTETEKKKNEKKKKIIDEVDEDDDNDEDKKKEKKDVIDDDEESTEAYLDVGRSFLEAYKSLSPKQIEGLTFDTKSLLTTQQKLIETLNSIGPTLKEGKNILTTFKDYFVEEDK